MVCFSYFLFARVCKTFLGIYMFFHFLQQVYYVYMYSIYTVVFIHLNTNYCKGKRSFPSCLSDTPNPCFFLAVSEPSKKGGSKLGDER